LPSGYNIHIEANKHNNITPIPLLDKLTIPFGTIASAFYASGPAIDVKSPPVFKLQQRPTKRFYREIVRLVIM